MKALLKEYGGGIYILIVALAVFGVLFGFKTVNGGTGIISAIGDVATANDKDDEILTASQNAVKDVMTRKEPVITVKESKCNSNTTYSVSDLATAKDTDGNMANVSCTKVLDNQNNDITPTVYSEGNITFASRGIYKVVIFAVDEQGAYTTKYITINVNN